MLGYLARLAVQVVVAVAVKVVVPTVVAFVTGGTQAAIKLAQQGINNLISTVKTANSKSSKKATSNNKADPQKHSVEEKRQSAIRQKEDLFERDISRKSLRDGGLEQAVDPIILPLPGDIGTTDSGWAGFPEFNGNNVLTADEVLQQFLALCPDAVRPSVQGIFFEGYDVATFPSDCQTLFTVELGVPVDVVEDASPGLQNAYEQLQNREQPDNPVVVAPSFEIPAWSQLGGTTEAALAGIRGTDGAEPPQNDWWTRLLALVVTAAAVAIGVASNAASIVNSFRDFFTSFDPNNPDNIPRLDDNNLDDLGHTGDIEGDQRLPEIPELDPDIDAPDIPEDWQDIPDAEMGEAIQDGIITTTDENPEEQDENHVVNRVGEPYPTYTDLRTGEPVPFPDPEQVEQRVPESERITWDSSANRRAYIQEWYDRGYPDPPLPWGEYDFHHIVPREYGGTNDFENLVPVERGVHQNEFNSFWNNWGQPRR